MKSRIAITIAVLLASLSSIAEEKPAERAPLELDFSSSDWIEDEELSSALSTRQAYTDEAIAAGADNPPYWDSSNSIQAVPASFTPWWATEALKPLSKRSTPVIETPESLALRAIKNSNQIRVFSDIPVIRETAELEARGEFDTHLYLDGKFTDLDDPVGSLLDTGRNDRFTEDEWSARLGLRKKFITGTEIDLSQRIGELNNNSDYLIPKEQARTRLAFTVTQPLLKGLGVRYNRSLIDIALIDGSVALDEFQRQAESHLLDVSRAYWGLYEARVSLLQRRKMIMNGTKVVKEMEGRVGYDIGPAQISRARANLASWRSDLSRAETEVRNAESKVLALINDPELRLSETFEMIAGLSPVLQGEGMSTDMAMRLAMENRPEINQAFKQIKAAASRAHMSKLELLPELNLVLQYYRAGIAGDYDISNAVDTQSDGESWVAGLRFDFPLRNRAARARDIRRMTEVRQLNDQLKTTLSTIKLELEVSTREIKTAKREIDAKYIAMTAAQTEVDVLKNRSGVEVNNSGSVHYLERLLGAIQRLAVAENEFLQSEVIYNVALANLDRATGTMLQTRNISARRYEDNDSGLPIYRLEQNNEGS